MMYCTTIPINDFSARGDTFEEPDEYLTYPVKPTAESNTTLPLTTTDPTPTPTAPADPDAHTCSGRTFDDFMQLKNGSVFAFRGDF